MSNPANHNDEWPAMPPLKGDIAICRYVGTDPDYVGVIEISVVDHAVPPSDYGWGVNPHGLFGIEGRTVAEKFEKGRSDDFVSVLGGDAIYQSDDWIVEFV